jgi:hypothetical protein
LRSLEKKNEKQKTGNGKRKTGNRSGPFFISGLPFSAVFGFLFPVSFLFGSGSSGLEDGRVARRRRYGFTEPRNEDDFRFPENGWSRPALGPEWGS